MLLLIYSQGYPRTGTGNKLRRHAFRIYDVITSVPGEYVTDMKKLFQLLCLGLALSATSACNEIDSPNGDAAPNSQELNIDGNCEIYSLNNHEGTSWSIVSDVEWIVPVKSSGEVSDNIEIYVESNSSGNRTGAITIEYSNGVTKSTTVQQNTDQSTPSVQRSYAVGWGFDVTSYMDSRGLKDQIFNGQKMLEYEGISNERDTKTSILVFYGESHSSLTESLKAHLNIDNLKIAAFEMSLKGTFGQNSLSNSDRIFSWMRGTYRERLVNNQIDPADAQDMEVFTKDFAEERQKVIDANGSEKSIKDLISRYGTHHVKTSYLGGYLDYYFSSVVENTDNSMNIDGALKFGYNNMFKINGDGTYKDAYNSLNKEKIEKFNVKGGDAIDLTNKVISGTINDKDLKIWLASLTDGDVKKYELIDFEIAPIWELFPNGIDKKIKKYIETTLYYSDLPVTRTTIKDLEF